MILARNVQIVGCSRRNAVKITVRNLNRIRTCRVNDGRQRRIGVAVQAGCRILQSEGSTGVVIGVVIPAPHR